MAVIVRETRPIGGEARTVDVYLSTRPVGDAQREQALKLDESLRKGMAQLTNEVRDEGYLGLKGRPGVVRLWWEVGWRLRRLVDPLDVGPEEDRQYVWRAIYDHAPDLVPGAIGSRAARLLNSHFRYCYLLGAFDWATVRDFGDWTSWVEVFDSERIRNDPRIADWLVARVTRPGPAWATFASENRMAWFRPLAKALRARFDHRDSGVLDVTELYAELDETASSVMTDRASTHSGLRGQRQQAGRRGTQTSAARSKKA